MSEIPITEVNAVRAKLREARTFLYEGRPVAAYEELISASEIAADWGQSEESGDE